VLDPLRLMAPGKLIMPVLPLGLMGVTFGMDGSPFVSGYAAKFSSQTAPSD
jgi:hypothetical protein